MKDAPNSEAASVERSRAWSQYWRTGAQHSLPGTIDLQKDSSVRRFWSTSLANLKPQDRVLDIGSGNGPLTRLLLDLYGYDNCPEVDAVDLSHVAPPWLAATSDPQAKLRFHNQTRLEALPFDSESFSMVVSQFGFEYAHVEEGTAETARVLKPGGRLALLVHDTGSRLAAVARDEVSAISSLLANDGFMDRAEAFYPVAARRETGKGLAQGDESAQRQFQAGLAAFREQAAAAQMPDVLIEAHNLIIQLLKVCRAQRSSIAARSAHDEYKQQLIHSRLRSSELCDAALDSDGIARLRRLLVTNGIDVETDAQLHHENGALLGRTLFARKRL